jgi:acetylornithine deacetylase/succinyl-diaminopimelate desuccinylase-like protein
VNAGGKGWVDDWQLRSRAKVASNSSRPLAYAKASQEWFVTELKEFVSFPSVSARPENAGDMVQCAEWLAKHLRRIGMQRVRVTSTRGHPLVYGEWIDDPRRPTVIIYGHYDVQPADPLDQWRSPPFAPLVRENNIYGRGASDDKGQLFAHLKALESCLRTTGTLPVNVKCLFEGEEEIGSPNFAPFLAQNKTALAADIVVVSDTLIPSTDRPAITYAMRGALSLELEVTGAESDLHDGLFGGMINNPLKGLCDIVAGLHTSAGKISIPGFYDRVLQVSPEERRFMARNGPTDAKLLKSAGTAKFWGEQGFTLYERTTIRPSLTISGITGGYQGVGPKSVIPARASAKLNFRLVPHQNPREIEQLVRKQITRLTPFTLQSTTRTYLSADPVVVDRNHPLIRAAAAACGKGFGASPVFVRSGGTNPAVAAFQNILGVPIALMGFGLANDQIHAPNEKFNLSNFRNGIATSVLFMHEVGDSEYIAKTKFRQSATNPAQPRVHIMSHDY